MKTVKTKMLSLKRTCSEILFEFHCYIGVLYRVKNALCGGHLSICLSVTQHQCQNGWTYFFYKFGMETFTKMCGILIFSHIDP
jgi:hypothetical protein